jgi:hypothetical protein
MCACFIVLVVYAQRKANINIMDKHDNTALILAVFSGSVAARAIVLISGLQATTGWWSGCSSNQVFEPASIQF